MEEIKIENLSFSYTNSDKKALDNINISIEEGEFVLICGESGGGKSTLLRHLKPELTPSGKRSGSIKYYGKNLMEWDLRKTSSEIGYVLQNPESQIVTDKVYHELAFGLENLGVENDVIRRRVAEMSSFFGIQEWFRKDVVDLSGGQKQLLNLASIMVMQPKILILDEPTSQLDPIAAKDFLDILVRINKELSTTIIITEHNLEDIFSICDKVVVIEHGKVLTSGTTRSVSKTLCTELKGHNIVKALPIATRVFNSIYKDILYSGIDMHTMPLNVREGKKFIKDILENPKNRILDKEKVELKDNPVIEMKDVWFKYDKNLEPTLRNVSLKVNKGEFYSILGGNGTGKSTTLSIISNFKKPLRGKVFINGINIKKYKGNSLYKENLGVLPQNPQSLFVFDTLREDLLEVFNYSELSLNEKEKIIFETTKKLGINKLLNQHPYDLSGGELQRAGLAKVLLLNPKILLLDEPTKGLDTFAKEEIGNLLLDLKRDGLTIVLVSHDIEFCAKFSDRCALFFDGTIVSEECSVEFFKGNSFYTTVGNRMTREIFDNGITCEDVINLCKINMINQKVN